MLERTMGELGVSFDLEPDTAQILALRYVCRRHLEGDITMREAARWAHTYVGHDGADVAQELVMLDDDLEIGPVIPFFATAARRRSLLRAHEESLTQRLHTFLDATADVGRQKR